VLLDLEEFMKELKDKSAAWAELEKISKKSKKKKTTEGNNGHKKVS